MVKQFSWAPGSTKPADPGVIGEWLEMLGKTQGEITPAVMVAAAKAKSSPAHDLFDWSDESAARKYRLTQARSIVNSLRVTEIKNGAEQHTVHAYVSVVEESKRQYVSAAYIRNDAELLEFAKNEIKIMIGTLERKLYEFDVAGGEVPAKLTKLVSSASKEVDKLVLKKRAAA